MTPPPVMRYGSPKRDAGILGPPAKGSYVVEATIWDTRDADAAEVVGSPGIRSALDPRPAGGMAVNVACTTFRKSFTRRRYVRLQQSSGETPNVASSQRGGPH